MAHLDSNSVKCSIKKSRVNQETSGIKKQRLSRLAKRLRRTFQCLARPFSCHNPSYDSWGGGHGNWTALMILNGPFGLIRAHKDSLELVRDHQLCFSGIGVKCVSRNHLAQKSSSFKIQPGNSKVNQSIFISSRLNFLKLMEENFLTVLNVKKSDICRVVKELSLKLNW